MKEVKAEDLVIGEQCFDIPFNDDDTSVLEFVGFKNDKYYFKSIDNCACYDKDSEGLISFPNSTFYQIEKSMTHPDEITKIETLIITKGGSRLTDEEKKSLDCLLNTVYLDGRIDKLKELQKEIRGGDVIMTKQEAIKAMSEGRKVTHRYFDKDEYIRMRNFGAIIDPSIYWLSDKHQVTSAGFWHDRSGMQWNDGWELF